MTPKYEKNLTESAKNLAILNTGIFLFFFTFFFMLSQKIYLNLNILNILLISNYICIKLSKS